MTVAEMRDMAGSLGRRLTRRTTLYDHVHPRSAQDNPVLIDDPIS
jgi:hypothetical protein